MKYSYSPSGLDASQSQGHPRHSSLNLPLPMIDLCGERRCKQNDVPKNTTQCPHLGLETRDGRGEDYTLVLCLYSAFTGFALMATDRSYVAKACHSHFL